MEAAGMYLRVLREERRMSRVDIASVAGTNEAQIIRIEKGELDTRGSLLLAFACEVRADLNELADLVLSKEMTAADGRRIAEMRLIRRQQPMLDPATGSDEHLLSLGFSHDDIQKIDQLIRTVPRDRLDAILNEVAEEFAPAPGLWDAVLSLIRGWSRHET